MSFSRKSLLLALALVGCQRASPPNGSTTEPASPGDSASASADEQPLSDASLYDLHMKLVDQDGNHVGLDTFAGHPVVVSMFYGSCPYACPTLIRDVKRIIDALPPRDRGRVRVLLVSFDPSRDTVAELKQLAERHRVEPGVWRLARTSDDEVRDLAAVLGIKYKKLPDGEFNHQSVITVLDAGGVPRFRQDGLGDPPDHAARALGALASRPPSAI
ncbi:MAG: SCO family protein [Myxococcales bacterium]|nr:SCO family protein [Myxococcales bacterium]